MLVCGTVLDLVALAVTPSRPWTVSPRSRNRISEFKISYWFRVYSSCQYWWVIDEGGSLQTRKTSVCVYVSWSNEVVLSYTVLYIYVQTPSAKINEIPHKWRYLHCLKHCTFVPRQVFLPVEQETVCSSPRKRQKEEGMVNYVDRRKGPTGNGNRIKRSNMKKCWNLVWTGHSFVAEAKNAAVNQHFPRLHPSAAPSYKTCAHPRH